MKRLSDIPKIEGVDLPVLPSHHAQCNDKPVHWFVLTPSGYSVFVESHEKGVRLRRLYDEMGLGWCSLMCEETDNAHSIPF